MIENCQLHSGSSSNFESFFKNTTDFFISVYLSVSPYEVTHNWMKNFNFKFLILQGLGVILCTTRFNIKILRFVHKALSCFVCFSEQMAIISLHSYRINWLVFVVEGGRVSCAVGNEYYICCKLFLIFKSWYFMYATTWNYISCWSYKYILNVSVRLKRSKKCSRQNYDHKCHTLFHVQFYKI